MNKKDLTGQKFNRWTVVATAGSVNGRSLYTCVCDCGVVKNVVGMNLTRNLSKSCGCFNLEQISKRRTTHGLSNSRFYRRWSGMKTRCLNANEKCYKHYGGKGITICERWKSFKGFKEDMFDSYSEHVKEFGTKETTLDRIDSNKGYSKDNCRWASVSIQANNKTSNRVVEYCGESLTIGQLAKKTGKNYHFLYDRIMKKWEINDAVNLPKQLNQYMRVSS
jgi:hypothetical protein